MLRGGLGNQLFQYAAGVSLSRRLDVELELSSALLPRHEVHNGFVSAWPEQISSFDHLGRFEAERTYSTSRHYLQTRLHQTVRLLGDKFPGPILNLGLFANESHASSERFSRISSPVTIDSYCANPAFFQDVMSDVVASIEKVSHPSAWFLTNSEMARTQNPIGIHIRLGDFQRLSHLYGKPRLGYIERGLELLKERFPKSQIWLFSDDPSSASALFGENTFFDRVLAAPSESKPVESLLLLSQCAAIVASNSTFSWWAALIGHRTGMTAIFPRPLYPISGVAEPKHYLLDNWIQIGGD
jgi:hypothetical protein